MKTLVFDVILSKRSLPFNFLNSDEIFCLATLIVELKWISNMLCRVSETLHLTVFLAREAFISTACDATRPAVMRVCCPTWDHCNNTNISGISEETSLHHENYVCLREEKRKARQARFGLSERKCKRNIPQHTLKTPRIIHEAGTIFDKKTPFAAGSHIEFFWPEISPGNMDRKNAPRRPHFFLWTSFRMLMFCIFNKNLLRKR